MGSYLSKISSTAPQLSQSHLHDPPLQSYDFSGVSTPSANLDIEYPNLPPPINLYTRLAIFEKELRDAQLEIARKEVVIQYLLSDKLNNSIHDDSSGHSGRKVLSLENQLVFLNNDSEIIKTKLQDIQNIFASLSPSTIVTKDPGATSVSSSTCKGSESENDKQEDLIDLLDFREETDSARAIKGEVPFLNPIEDESTDEDDDVAKSAPGPDQYQSFSSDPHEVPYIHHFVSSEYGSGQAKHEVNVDNQAEHQPRFTKQISRLLTKFEKPDSLTDAEGLPSGYASSSSLPVSASSSFGAVPVQEPKQLTASRDLSGLSHSQLITYAQSVWSEATGACSSVGNNEAELYLPAPETATPTLPLPNYLPAKTFRDRVPSTELRWAVSNVFKSEQERERVVSINRREVLGANEKNVFPDLLKYGIRYIPHNGERDIYRSVIISGVPPKITTMKLLDKVRGGMIMDAKILNTTAITGTHSALVTFLHGYSAIGYQKHTVKHPVVFDGLVARVSIVSTPTWPIPLNLRNLIYYHGRTRCFEVHNFPTNISASVLKRDLTKSPSMKSSSVEYMQMSRNRVLSLRFTSVTAAGNKAAYIQHAPRYSGSTLKFSPDPCAQPLETLLQDRECADPHSACNQLLEMGDDSTASAPAEVDSNLIDQTALQAGEG